MRRAAWTIVLLACLAACLLAPGVAGAQNDYIAKGTGDLTLFPPGAVGCWCHGLRYEAKGPHAGFSSTTSLCDTCHLTAHDAAGPNLLFQSRTTLVCRACHDGTGGGGIYDLTSHGVTPGGAHRIEGTSAVPGGDAATGGSATRTFLGLGGRMGCEDCHSPHGSNTVTPFTHYRTTTNDWSDPGDLLLRKRPTGAVTTATQYGSDWCMTCHAGRSSGGTVHNHPVDSLLTRPDPFTHDNVAFGGIAVPTPLAVSPDSGSVYVADAGNDRVSQFTTQGAPVRQWPVTTNSILWGLSLTGDKDVDGQRDLVTSSRDLDGSGRYPVCWWTQSGAAAGSRSYTADVWTVGDNRAGTAPTGVTWHHITDLSTGNQAYRIELDSCYGVVVSDSGRIFVADANWNRVSVFDRTNTNYPFLFAFPADATPVPLGGGDGRFSRPMGIAITPGPVQTVYVADSGNDRVQYFSTDGTFLGKWGVTGDGPGQLRRPSGIAIGPDRTVWVTDANNRVQAFTETGTFIRQFGSRGEAPGELAFESSLMKPLDVNDNAAFLMADPRLILQQGHAPICQQCHEDSRDAGDLVSGEPSPTAIILPSGQWGPGRPTYNGFPHETAAQDLLIEEKDDLCLNCHATGTLP